MSLGEKLKCLRLNNRRTLKEQSVKLGVSLNSVYRWEHDIVEPRQMMMKKIASLHETPMEWLLQDSDTEDFPVTGTDAVCVNQNLERQLLGFFRNLSTFNQYKVLGYVERLYTETIDKNFADWKPVASGE